MNVVSLNNLWNYLQGLSLSASNQRWLGERLLEASTVHAATTKEDMKLKKLNSLFGVWSGPDGERIEATVKEARDVGYDRELIWVLRLTF